MKRNRNGSDKKTKRRKKATGTAGLEREMSLLMGLKTSVEIVIERSIYWRPSQKRIVYVSLNERAVASEPSIFRFVITTTVKQMLPRKKGSEGMW